MTAMQSVVGTVGFSVAAVAYAVVAVLVLLSGDRSREARYLSGALCVSAAWSTWHVATVWEALAGLDSWNIAADAARIGVWVVCLIALLTRDQNGRVPRAVPTFLFAVALAACVLVALGNAVGSGSAAAIAQASRVALAAAAFAAVAGLIGSFRRSALPRRGALEPLVLGTGLVFATDALVYSYSLAFPGSFGTLGIAQAVVAILVVPAMAVAARRLLQWHTAIFLSRDLSFYIAGLIAIVLYVAAMFSAALMFAEAGSRWGVFVQFGLLLAGTFVMYRLLLSSAARRRIRVFVTKHFYRERYDYRKEWLRLIETLVGRAEDAPIAVRTVRALAEIIDSNEGELWLEGRSGLDYEPHGSWGGPLPASALARTDPLPAYLAESHWVVDTQEYLKKPGVYSNVFSLDEPFLKQPSIYIPIVHEDRLLGIVRLERPPGLGDLSFEDHDLLKTAGQQVAVFLVQARAQEQLFETRQFEAFSKLTAFLMHDLKNVIAQQNLVVANARRFRHRPEFIDDAMSTIASSVERMRRILERLQSATRFEKPARIQLPSLLREACGECADRAPAPVLAVADSEELYVEMDRDRLNMVVTHLIRNAQDATLPGGVVEVSVAREAEFARIDVRDTGCGMEPEFIRDRLFKPFDSTKGAQGMGIGAYQIRETVNAAGGCVEVRSEPGVGTTMTVKLPLTAPRRLAEWAVDGGRAVPPSKVSDSAGT
jgi:putative PEP-CTERM system histidine kinase